MASPVVPITEESWPRIGQVSRKMSPVQIASLLDQHGAKDITDNLDFESCSPEPFAHGGFGSIYRGKLKDGQPVAIKCIGMRGNWGAMELGGNICEQAAHELYTWSKCNHSGILKTLGFALSEGSILLVSPWMENGSLTRHLMRNDSYDRLEFCIDLANTVEYLHAKGIVHGDIKGDNILVSDDGDIQLVDFGSATLANYLTLRFTRTSSELAWSIRFAAPEIMRETCKTHTTKSDVYSLGMTILQILTGELPYAGKSDMVALVKVIDGKPPLRPMADGILQNERVGDNLWGLLLRCWDHDPDIRPTATEVKQTLVVIKRALNAS